MAVTKKIGYSIYLIVFTIVAAEIILRIYNPIHSTVVGNKIALTVNATELVANTDTANDLDAQVVVCRNNLGFRGAVYPHNSGKLKMLAIGGSTTECTYITDGKTWEDILGKKLDSAAQNVWINNAGMNGHSTFGHLVLLKQYVLSLKPDICLFLVGINDVDRGDLSFYDSNFTQVHTNWKDWITSHSRLADFVLNLYRSHKQRSLHLTFSKQFSLSHNTPLELPDTVINTKLQQQTVLIKNYGSRLQQIVSLCRLNKIEPVFITQPYLLGEGTDDKTGVNLTTYRIEDTLNGKLQWKKLELYNRQAQAVAAANNVFVIDLAHLLPKSSRYFYDLLHFNNTGCYKVGSIVAEKLIPHLQTKYNRSY